MNEKQHEKQQKHDLKNRNLWIIYTKNDIA